MSDLDQPFDFQLRTRVVYGAGKFAELGPLGAALAVKRMLLVADRGIVAAGYAARAVGMLEARDIEVTTFSDFDVNPDGAVIEAGRAFAAPLKIEAIIGLGGGSSLDCAKGINFVLTNGGRIQDYWGYGKAYAGMLPMIAVPTTAGTGSEAQTYALISDEHTHVKMACGDPKAAFQVAILDPALTVSQPRHITATAGYDAIAHAVETYVTTKRSALSAVFSREGWRLLEANYERVLNEPANLEARGAMQQGAFFAGVAIENSMLGATHACANPLTARYGTTHGDAIAMLLATVVRWNGKVAGERYRELLSLSSAQSDQNATDPAAALARRLEALALAGGLRRGLGDSGVPESDLEMLALDAAQQWTGKFNPRSFDADGAREVYENAY